MPKDAKTAEAKTAQVNLRIHPSLKAAAEKAAEGATDRLQA
jgi:hypothetical protein